MKAQRAKHGAALRWHGASHDARLPSFASHRPPRPSSAYVASCQLQPFAAAACPYRTPSARAACSVCFTARKQRTPPPIKPCQQCRCSAAVASGRMCSWGRTRWHFWWATRSSTPRRACCVLHGTTWWGHPSKPPAAHWDGWRCALSCGRAQRRCWTCGQSWRRLGTLSVHGAVRGQEGLTGRWATHRQLSTGLAAVAAPVFRLSATTCPAGNPFHAARHSSGPLRSICGVPSVGLT